MLKTKNIFVYKILNILLIQIKFMLILCLYFSQFLLATCIKYYYVQKDDSWYVPMEIWKLIPNGSDWLPSKTKNNNIPTPIYKQ